MGAGLRSSLLPHWLKAPFAFRTDSFRQRYLLARRTSRGIGRTAIVKYHDETASTLGPADLNVRTLVHEYGWFLATDV